MLAHVIIIDRVEFAYRGIARKCPAARIAFGEEAKELPLDGAVDLVQNDVTYWHPICSPAVPTALHTAMPDKTELRNEGPEPEAA